MDTASRLACYDALADALKDPPSAGPTAAGTAPTTAATSTIATSADNRSRELAFGLAAAARTEVLESIQSAVGPSFDGWGPNRRIRLVNGQVWQVIDGSSVALSEGARKVTVKRGALSSFYLDIEGLQTSPRVRRVE